jgi:preprotein translocase subunit SecG
MLFSLLLSIHVVICVLVILAVLIQSGKGAGFAGMFGGGGGDALFSAPSGSMFIRKVTTGLAVAFFVSSLFLTFLGARRGGQTVTQRLSIPAAPTADSAAVPLPVAPAPMATQEAPADKK